MATIQGLAQISSMLPDLRVRRCGSQANLTSYKIASWNIEKNGQSSDLIKQTKVSDFIDRCCQREYDVIFLCEVHSARVNDYIGFLASVYSENYKFASLPGGHSNAYILIYRRQRDIRVSQDVLRGLNRGAFIIRLGNGLVLGLAHFKSGQTGLTKDQLQQASSFLESMSPGHWAITGDMNWDYNNRNELAEPPGRLPGGSHSHTCWDDQTHAKGGILDWCLAGGATQVVEVLERFPPETNDMTGPDHRPVVFEIDLP